MPRYIDIDKMNRWTEVDHESCSRDSCDSCDYDCNECYYNNGGAEDVVPVIHARWLHWEELYECSNCGFALKDNSAKYCQHCGAKMDGDEMTIEELIAKLKNLLDNGTDIENDHAEADRLLVEYINDDEVRKLFDELDKWYA